MVETDWYEAQRNVVGHDRSAENEGEDADRPPLRRRAQRLVGNQAQAAQCYLAHDHARGHVAGCQKDGKSEVIAGEKSLVEEENADIAGKP